MQKKSDQESDVNLMSMKPVEEGPVKVAGKVANNMIIRTANQGESTNLEAVDSTHAYVITDKV